MPYGRANNIEAWLLGNLGKQESIASLGSPTIGNHVPADSYRLHVLRLMLAIAAVASAAMWYQEESLKLIGVVDRIGYPLMLAVTTLGAVLLFFRPESLHAVVTTVLGAFITYLLSDYYYLTYEVLSGSSSSYQLATMALWLPLGYVGCYVFYSPQVAVRTSLAIYAAVSLPQWVLLGVDASSLGRQIAMAMLISHPVYIAALWGVAKLKVHANGVHDLAQSMSAAATEDPLTGVANRRGMRHALETLTRAGTDLDRPVALLLLDVDGFKGINDKFGHAVGDDVLIALAHKVRTHLRNSDLLGRWGGEEFMILSLDHAGPQALQMADRLRTELEEHSYPDVGKVTVSVGVTMLIPGESIEAFVKRADDALYQAKERGRNRVEGLFS